MLLLHEVTNKHGNAEENNRQVPPGGTAASRQYLRKPFNLEFKRSFTSCGLDVVDRWVAGNEMEQMNRK